MLSPVHKYFGRIVRLWYRYRYNQISLSEAVEIQKSHTDLPYVSNYKTLIPARHISLSMDDFRPLLEVSPYYHDGVYKQPELFVCKVHEPYFHSHIGALVSTDYRLIIESDMNRERASSNTLIDSYIRSSRSLEGMYTSVISRYPKAYSHWLIDVLSRTYGLSLWQGERPTVLMADKTPEKYREMLQFCLPEGYRVEYSPHKGWLRPEDFILVSYPINNQSGYFPPEVRTYLRHRLFTGYNVPEENTYDKNIYISRQDSQRRRLLNEDEIINYLCAHGFEVYELAQLSIREQIDLFRRAKTVVAPHGAGLVNLLFAGARTKVVEFINTRHPLTWYLLLALSMEQDYHFVFPKHFVGRHDDFKIELEDLEKTLSNIL